MAFTKKVLFFGNKKSDAGLLVLRDVVVDVVENRRLVPPVRHDNGGSTYLSRHDACEATRRIAEGHTNKP
jgi:hypothetical protein